MFKPKSQLICATLLTGVYDVNRNELLADDDFKIIEKWYQSVIKLNLNGVVFHNNFSNQTVKTYQNKNIQFIKVAYDGHLNANVYRYLIYKDFLEAYADKISHLFVTDIADVEVLKNPFKEPLFLENTNHLFCGDESEILNSEWMIAHNTHLRDSIVGFSEFEIKNKNQTLLNCGVIGGSINVILKLMNSLANIHQTYTIYNKTAYTLDMGAFNYITRTQFASKLKHGQPINTLFKKYESERKDCWFRHK